MPDWLTEENDTPYCEEHDCSITECPDDCHTKQRYEDPDIFDYPDIDLPLYEE